MFASIGMQRLLDPPWENVEQETRFNELKADLDRFIDSASMIPIAEPPSTGKLSYLKRVGRLRDEVWEIKSRDPAPQLRVFGRFAQKDVFIALTCSARGTLGNRTNIDGTPNWGGALAWRTAIRQCVSDWNALLPAYPPHAGASTRDYVSNAFLV